MKKNIFQIVIVFMTVLVLSTTVMARGKKHDKHKHNWWNPFSSLWSAVHELQEETSNIDEKIEAKLKELSLQDSDGDPSSSSTVDSGVGPLICPSCVFPMGPLDPQFGIESRMKGAYLGLAQFYGTHLQEVDLSEAYLGGAQFYSCQLTDAVLTDADFSPFVQKSSSGDEYLIYTTFANTNLDGAVFNGNEKGIETIMWKAGTICPDGVHVIGEEGVDSCLNYL